VGLFLLNYLTSVIVPFSVRHSHPYLEPRKYVVSHGNRYFDINSFVHSGIDPGKFPARRFFSATTPLRRLLNFGSLQPSDIRRAASAAVRDRLHLWRGFDLGLAADKPIRPNI